MEQLELFKPKKPPRKKAQPQEWKLVSVRECPTPEAMQKCNTPHAAAEYWRLHVEGNPFFDSERECFVVIVLNTTMRARVHHLVSVGTLNECVVHPRDVFRVAVVCAAYGVVFMHNHPRGEPEPSQADVVITRQLADAAKLFKIEVIDHVIIGHERHCSFREMGLL